MRFGEIGIGRVTGRGTAMNPHIHSSAADELFALQVAQLKHDEFYHREIARLTVHARLNHMALHFAKYVGQLAGAVESDDRRLIRRTITDAFVIALSSANTLGLSLGAAIPFARDARSLAELGRMLPDDSNRPNRLLLSFAVPTGRIARACEKLDHVEGFPFRETIIEGVVALCQASIVAAQGYDFDLPSSVRDRFAEIESKYLFHSVEHLRS
jgi:hypothetical protein